MGKGSQTITLRTQEIRMKFLLLIVATLCFSAKSHRLQRPAFHRSEKDFLDQVPIVCRSNFRSPTCKAFWLSPVAINFCTRVIASYSQNLTEKSKVCCLHPLMISNINGGAKRKC